MAGVFTDFCIHSEREQKSIYSDLIKVISHIKNTK